MYVFGLSMISERATTQFSHKTLSVIEGYTFSLFHKDLVMLAKGQLDLWA